MTQTTRPNVSEISARLASSGLNDRERDLAASVLHKCWVPDLIDSVNFGQQGLSAGIQALRRGRPVVVDSAQLKQRLDSQRLAKFRSSARFVAEDFDVVEVAKLLGTPAGVLAMRKSAQMFPDAVFVFSESSEAAQELADIIKKGDASPPLIVTVPQGERISQTGCPYVRLQGDKANLDTLAALINGLIRVATDDASN